MVHIYCMTKGNTGRKMKDKGDDPGGPHLPRSFKGDSLAQGPYKQEGNLRCGTQKAQPRQLQGMWSSE